MGDSKRGRAGTKRRSRRSPRVESSPPRTAADVFRRRDRRLELRVHAVRSRPRMSEVDYSSTCCAGGVSTTRSSTVDRWPAVGLARVARSGGSGSARDQTRTRSGRVPATSVGNGLPGRSRSRHSWRAWSASRRSLAAVAGRRILLAPVTMTTLLALATTTEPALSSRGRAGAHDRRRGGPARGVQPPEGPSDSRDSCSS